MRLANKYRPQSFDDVVGQSVTTKILNNYIKDNVLESMLFVGPAGCGKTTCARIFANNIDGETMEIDAARNNGVKEIKGIIDYAKTTSLTNANKVIIFDEAHTITPEGWQSLLITLEEGVKHTIFIFCTTDPRKIPNTVISRLKVFHFNAIDQGIIFERLCNITEREQLNISKEVLDYITRISNNNLREALTCLEQCIDYDKNISIDDAYKVLNHISDRGLEKFFDFIHSDKVRACKYIKKIQHLGFDLYTFIEDCLQYSINKAFNDISFTPNVDFCLNIMQELKYMISNPGSIYTFICAKVLTYDWSKDTDRKTI